MIDISLCWVLSCAEGAAYRSPARADARRLSADHEISPSPTHRFRVGVPMTWRSSEDDENGVPSPAHPLSVGEGEGEGEGAQPRGAQISSTSFPQFSSGNPWLSNGLTAPPGCRLEDCRHDGMQIWGLGCGRQPALGGCGRRLLPGVARGRQPQAVIHNTFGVGTEHTGIVPDGVPHGWLTTADLYPHLGLLDPSGEATARLSRGMNPPTQTAKPAGSRLLCSVSPRFRDCRFSPAGALRDAARRRRLLRASGWIIVFKRQFPFTLRRSLLSRRALFAPCRRVLGPSRRVLFPFIDSLFTGVRCLSRGLRAPGLQVAGATPQASSPMSRAQRCGTSSVTTESVRAPS
jgi:hypothetical protein